MSKASKSPLSDFSLAPSPGQKTRCAARTTSGEQCRRDSANNSTFCPQHSKSQTSSRTSEIVPDLSEGELEGSTIQADLMQLILSELKQMRLELRGFCTRVEVLEKDSQETKQKVGVMQSACQKFYDETKVQFGAQGGRITALENNVNKVAAAVKETTKRQEDTSVRLQLASERIEALAAQITATVAVPRTFAAAVGTGSVGGVPPRGAGGSQGAAADHRLCFSVAGISEDVGKGSMGDLAKHVQRIVGDKTGVSIHVQEVFRLGKLVHGAAKPRSVFFRVLNPIEARDMAVKRGEAARGGLFINDFLTPEELDNKNKLWPKFKAAREEKKKAQFRRGQLFVEGKEVVA